MWHNWPIVKILAIETSCDETAISTVDAQGEINSPTFSVLSDITLSQAKLHAKHGGVFPALAKREHAKNLVPVFIKALSDSGLHHVKPAEDGPSLTASEGPSFVKIEGILSREPELLKQFLEFVPFIEKPNIDAIAVTVGPGLEPALWVGINFAKALSEIWEIPVIPVNHMEGHVLAGVLVHPKSKSIPNNLPSGDINFKISLACPPSPKVASIKSSPDCGSRY